MATQQRNVSTDLQRVRTNLANPRLGGANIPNRNEPQQQQPQQQQDMAALDPSFYQPSSLATNSSLMIKPVSKRNYPASCWFEPLGYCTDGLNRNCWCSWHVRHLFNGQSTGEYVTVMNNDQMEVIKYNRLLTYMPMPFAAALVRAFPIIEMFQSLTDLESSLNFGLLHYTLTHSSHKRSPDDVNRIVLEHKVYFMLMMEAACSNSETSTHHIDIDPIIRINTSACVNYVSSNLIDKDYTIHLVLTQPNSNQLQHLDLRKCTALTQSIALLFDLPYAFPPDMNVCLANTPAFLIADNALVVDETKMHLGTYLLENGIQTYGSPCTLSLFRLDRNGEVSFYDRNYRRANLKCVDTVVDRRRLLQYAIGGDTNAIQNE